MSNYSTYDEEILVVDDEPANLKLLDRQLRQAGYENVRTVDDPLEVVEQYRARRPDLILLDLAMPRMDGFEVLEQLQSMDDPLLPPVVVLTAQHGRDSLLKALQAGARDFLAKPFDRGELLMRVRNLLDAHLAHRMMYDKKEALESMVSARTQELRETRLQIVQRLGRASEYRDEETGRHILRISYMCSILARSLGWSREHGELMLHASPMHDIGKIGIPDAILRKPGKLTADEWDVMKTHTTIGAALLEGDESSLLQLAHEIALTHHERWDGSGYPHGLAGEAIPRAGHIVAITDVFDALTSERPYKRAWSVEEAVDLITGESGRQFDPELVEVFMDNLSAITKVRQRFGEEHGEGQAS